VIVIGAGAVGNEVIKNLVLLGVGRIDVFDFDTIELSNLTRSVLFREEDVGKPKAIVAAERARELDPSVDIRGIHGDFWDTLQLGELQMSSAVICSVDNFAARIRANKLCFALSIDLVNVGIDSRFVSVEYFPFSVGDEVPCYECGLPETVYSRLSQRYSCGWLKKIAVEEKKVPTTILTSSAAGSFAVSMLLQGRLSEDAGKGLRLLVDTVSGRSTLSTFDKKVGCPGCGGFLPKRILIHAKRVVSGELFRESNGPVRDTLSGLIFTSSDQILVGYRNRNCSQCDPEHLNVVMGRADDYDENVVVCPDCGYRRREVMIRDQFSAGELLREFAGHRLPAKFLLWSIEDDQFIVELED
jgi:molybdopterin/thiamine biosynthesis adenylyltransferase/DNA-directed RNA polymerase subunit RPC12/RpoP